MKSKCDHMPGFRTNLKEVKLQRMCISYSAQTRTAVIKILYMFGNSDIKLKLPSRRSKGVLRQGEKKDKVINNPNSIKL